MRRANRITQEWEADKDDPKDDHRHVSHLFALYPGRLTRAVIHSQSGLPCRVVYGDQSWEFNTSAGKSYPFKLTGRV